MAIFTMQIDRPSTENETIRYWQAATQLMGCAQGDDPETVIPIQRLREIQRTTLNKRIANAVTSTMTAFHKADIRRRHSTILSLRTLLNAPSPSPIDKGVQDGIERQPEGSGRS